MRAVKTIPNVLLVAVLAFATWAAPASSTAQTPPDDSSRYHLVTVTSKPPTPGCTQLLAALDSPELAAIASRCKTFRFGPTDPIYVARYAQALHPAQLPVVALVRHDGGVIYKASGPSVPDAAGLANALREMAALDQAQHPRHQSPAALPYQPLVPDSEWRPNLRPGAIPDTVVVRPQVNVPDSVGNWLIVGCVLIVLMLFGVAAFALVGGIFLLTRSP